MSDLFEDARLQVSCRDVAERKGVKLRGSKKGARGVCPLNDCGANSGSSPFRVYPAKKGAGDRFACASCGQGGDVIELEHRLFGVHGESMFEAARRLVGGEGREISDDERARRAQRRAQEALRATESEAWKADLARRIWREAEPAAGTLAQTYLESRGPHGPVVARAVELLRFHPRAWHSGHPEFGVFLPAMIGLVMTEFGPTGGIHATYLKPDGRGKANRTPAKKMIGPQGHRCWARLTDGIPVSLRLADGLAEADEVELLLPGGIWLSRPDAAGPLVVAEGIENSLSRAWLKGGDLSLPMRAAAAGALDRLQGFEAQDDDRCVDVHRIVGDPLRPPFTWPEDPAAPWGELDVATDGDMSPIRVMGRAGRRKKPAKYQRDAAERARVCGLLATAGWRRRLAPESATKVHASRPPLGLDFNDELRRVQAAAASASEAA